MKYYIYLISLVLFSCQTKQKEEVRLEILNNALYYNKKYMRSLPENSGSMSYYRNQFDRKRASNVIIFQITNTTQKRFLFVIDEDNLYSDTMNFEISDENRNPVNCNSADVTFISNKEDRRSCKMYKDSIEFEKDSIIGIAPQFKFQNDLFKKGAFILHPNERKTFKVLLRLPIITEINRNELIQPAHCEIFQNKNIFRLKYRCKPELLIAGLLEFQKKDLEHNKIEIYSGELFSNYIPLVAR